MKPLKRSTSKDTLICLGDAAGQEIERLEIMHFPDRVKPSLCVGKGNTSTVLGHFNSEAAAKEFIGLVGRIAKANFQGNLDLLTKVTNDPLDTSS